MNEDIIKRDHFYLHRYLPAGRMHGRQSEFATSDGRNYFRLHRWAVLPDQGEVMLKVIKIAIPALALIGVVLSIWELGVYGDLWCLMFNIFCLVILFWWYLANVVFVTSKKERRNLAFRKVVKR